MYRYRKRAGQIVPERTLCIGIMLVVAVLLWLRDVNGFSVNKYIFVILLAPSLLFFKAPYVFFLWAFMMPLYVGLPGNFLTLVLLIRFIMYSTHQGSKGFDRSQFVRTLCLAVFMLIQNTALGFTRTFYMVFVVEIVLVYFIMSTDFEGELPAVVMYYSCGVAAVGVIMLAATLKYVPFSTLFSAATRLGDITFTTDMTVAIDPNFYGVFAVASVASTWCLITKGKYTSGQKTVAAIAAVVALIIGVIGLSRGFVLSLAVWFLIALLNEKKLKKKIGLILIVAIVVWLATKLIPGSIDALVARFEADDMATGNGRIGHMQRAVGRWLATPWTVLFGYGLFNCVAHFMQLQYLAGCGLVGFYLVVSWYYNFWKLQRPQTRRIDPSSMVPVIVVQFAAATVPVATSMTFMMPVVISILVFGEASSYNDKNDYTVMIAEKRE